MAPKTKGINKHDRKHYKRWSGIVQRCYNTNNRGYSQIGGVGITMEHTWSHINEKGLINFSNWVEAELTKHPEMRTLDFRVTRINLKKNYGPKNCIIAIPAIVSQNRFNNVLTFEIVVSMRKHKKEKPNASLIDMAILFSQNIVNISRALRGITWSNVNESEAPIKKRG